MVMVSLEKNNLCFLTAHSLKCHLNQSKRVTFFKKVHLNKKEIFHAHSQVIFYTLEYYG